MIGTAGNDTFNGTNTTFNAGNDSVLDVSTTDNDTYNLAVSAADVSAHKVSNVENINLTLTSVSAPTGGSGVAAGSYTGVKNLTITRADLTVGGSTIAGNKAIEVSGLDATAVAKVTAGAGTTTAVITQTKGGATLDLDAASGAAKGSVGISVIGSATINAANATGTVNVDLISGASTAEKAKALVINAAKADAIDVTSIATGKAAYLYGTASTSTVINSNVQDTLSNIENITGSDGADYLVGDVNDNVITGGAGNDYIKGGEGTDTFKFASSADANGADTIADFTVGSAGDVLDFSSFLSTVAVANSTDGTTKKYVGTALIASASGGVTALNISGKIGILKGTETALDTAAEVLSTIGASKSFAVTSNAVIIAAANDGTKAYVYYVDITLGSDPEAIDAGDVVLVGTMTTTADTVDLLVPVNFGL